MYVNHRSPLWLLTVLPAAVSPDGGGVDRSLSAAGV